MGFSAAVWDLFCLMCVSAMDNLDQAKVYFLAKHTFSLNMTGCLRASTDNLASPILFRNYLKK